MKRLLLVFASLLMMLSQVDAKKVKGSVRGPETVLSGVIVSDGYRFTKTAEDGTFELNTHKDARFVFVITPAGYVGDFSDGSVKFYLPIEGTEKFDFVLQRLPHDGDDYTIFSISDPQMAHEKHFKRFNGAPVADLKKMSAESVAGRNTIAMALGDIAWNKYAIYKDYKKAVSKIGIPFYSVIGNHDFTQNLSGIKAASVYEANFGPYNYAFFLGKDLVIGLNNIVFIANDNGFPDVSSWNNYEGYNKETLDFLRGILKFIDKDTHVIIAQHSPAVCSQVPIRGYDKFMKIIDGYKVDILSGHTHLMHTQRLSENVVDHNAGAICGAWWATLRCTDGTPRGYEIVTSKNGEVSFKWHNVDYPDDHQVEYIALGQSEKYPDSILANVWAMNDEWVCEWEQDGIAMGRAERTADMSPAYASEVLQIYKGDAARIPGYKKPKAIPHYYKVTPSKEASLVVMTIKAPDGRVWTKEFGLNINF